MPKFAVCMYARFENGNLDLRLRGGDVFVVTPKIEASSAFIEGLRTLNFTFFTPARREQINNAVGSTPEIVEEMFPQEKEEIPVAVEPIITIPEPSTDVVDVTPVEEKKEEILVFTKMFNVVKAVEAIKKETDIEKLQEAMRLDERKTVKRAIIERIKELTGGK